MKQLMSQSLPFGRINPKQRNMATTIQQILNDESGINLSERRFKDPMMDLTSSTAVFRSIDKKRDSTDIGFNPKRPRLAEQLRITPLAMAMNNTSAMGFSSDDKRSGHFGRKKAHSVSVATAAESMPQIMTTRK